MMISEEFRECVDCERVLPVSKFKKSGGGKYRGYRCMKCSNIRNRYGITGREFYRMLDDQLHCCLICEEPINEDTAVIDHCHEGKHVRSLLCQHCNLALGHLKHNTEITSRAVEYLTKHT